MAIKRIEIKSFKSLDELVLTDLSNVNIITGENGSGKSSILEAIFLFFDRNATDMFLKEMYWRSRQQDIKNLQCS